MHDCDNISKDRPKCRDLLDPINITFLDFKLEYSLYKMLMNGLKLKKYITRFHGRNRQIRLGRFVDNAYTPASPTRRRDRPAFINETPTLRKRQPEADAGSVTISRTDVYYII